MNVVLIFVQREILLDNQNGDVVGNQIINQGDDFTGAASQTAQFSDDQNIAWDKILQQFLNPSGTAMLARRDGNLNKVVDAEVMVSGIFQDFQPLVIQVLLALGQLAAHYGVPATNDLFGRLVDNFMVTSANEVQNQKPSHHDTQGWVGVDTVNQLVEKVLNTSFRFSLHLKPQHFITNL